MNGFREKWKNLRFWTYWAKNSMYSFWQKFFDEPIKEKLAKNVLKIHKTAIFGYFYFL